MENTYSRSEPSWFVVAEIPIFLPGRRQYRLASRMDVGPADQDVGPCGRGIEAIPGAHVAAADPFGAASGITDQIGPVGDRFKRGSIPIRH